MTLSPAARKLALVVHLTSSLGWIGAVMAYLALGVAAVTSTDLQTVRAAWTAMDLAPEADVFCSGLTPLWDGRLLVVGGTLLYPTDTNPFIGSKASYRLDPDTGWECTDDMTFGR